MVNFSSIGLTGAGAGVGAGVGTGAGAGAGAGVGAGAGAGVGAAQAAMKDNTASTSTKQILPNNVINLFCFICSSYSVLT